MKKHGLKLILDAAHMSGTKVNGICPGTWEGVDVAVYSYQAVKSLATADSGMICFADEKYDAFAGNPNIQIISAPHADECSYHTYEIAVPFWTSWQSTKSMVVCTTGITRSMLCMPMTMAPALMPMKFLGILLHCR